MARARIRRPADQAPINYQPGPVRTGTQRTTRQRAGRPLQLRRTARFLMRHRYRLRRRRHRPRRVPNESGNLPLTLRRHPCPVRDPSLHQRLRHCLDGWCHLRRSERAGKSPVLTLFRQFREL